MIGEHTRAVLTQDVPESGLVAGDVGTVVHIHKQAGRAEAAGYMLEFFTLDGETFAIVSVSAEAVRPVDHSEIAHARRLAAE